VRLTTKGRYAVTAMLDLAMHQGAGPTALADIARRQGISLSYLEQLFARLRKRGLVSSVRGPGGGYNLAREGSGGAANCHNDGPCLTHDLWQDLSDRIYDYLSHVSLQDLVDRRGLVEELGCRTGKHEVQLDRARTGHTSARV
jgi:Rrf2 family iron-sulfur cluster assembly transcriptional regulator